VLDEAEALLAIASVSRTSESVWLRREARFSTPLDLRESIELAWHPRAMEPEPGSWSDQGQLEWNELRALAEPVQRVLLEPGKAANAGAVPYGHYLLAVRAKATPWWGLAPIEVSDLEALAVIEDQALVLATWAEGGAAAVRYELGTHDHVTRGELDGKAKVLAFDPAENHVGIRHELRLASDFGPARLFGTAPGEVRHVTEERWLVHAMVDRPVVQPGGTVQGRIVLRRCSRAGEGRMRVPTTSVASACDVRVRASFGDAGTVVCSGRTDAHGLFAFAIEVPEVASPTGAVRLFVDVPDVDGESKPLRIEAGGLFAVAHFERAATSIATEGPEVLPESSDAVEVAAVVCYASGAPVDGQLVRAEIGGYTTALRTGADGRASLRIPLAEWEAWRLRAQEGRHSHDLEVVFRTLGPDGTEQSATHVVRNLAERGAPAAFRPWLYRYDEPRIDFEPAVVGQPCRVTAMGKAGARALLVVGRSRNARAFLIQFDENGRAAQSVDVLRVDWPRLDVALVDRETRVEDFAFVTLTPVVEVVVEAPATATPGSDIECRVRSQRPGALVTLAVADERLFAIEGDRTQEPTAELRPSVAFAEWQRMVRARLVEPKDALASLLRDGHVPELGEWSFSRGVTGSGGPAMGAGYAMPPMRADFRSVAHFETVVADANGLATFRVRMPSDLTTWRLTAAVVDENGEGTLARGVTSTRVPWSVEPVLPRGVREGDAFSLPLVVARDGEAKDATPNGDAKVEVAVQTEPKQLEATRSTVPASVGAGASRTVAVPMRAIASGDAKLGLELRSDAVLDRSERSLVIVRDAVVHPIVVAQRGEGIVRVPLPDGASADEELVVDVLLGDAAVWSRLERDLSVYPYGCAEQTLSKLLPYFAAVRATARRNEPVPAMDETFRRRLRAGLARLRQLRTGDSHFAFWPGGEVDVEISVLVKHGLAVLREAGVDLAAERLDVAGPVVLPPPLSKWASESGQRAFALAIEDAAASLRLSPDAVRARELAAVALPALDAEPAFLQLPERIGFSAGAIARLGLALLAAGERESARACLLRLD
ncbi:MAG: alpha-2-macroglobulin family protein, partial [Planctomycetota bacterium]